MLQKNPLLIFSRPLTYYGSPQNFQEEFDEIEEQETILHLGLETDLLFPFQQDIGLFLHWYDF